MPIWFQCKIRYQKELDNGSLKTINEAYLVDAMSFTEAEARLHQELSGTHREFDLVNVSRMRLADLFHYDDAETWFKCKVTYVTVDERNGQEKKVNNVMLVSAANAKQAYERIEESLKTMLVPFDITDINTSNILEIFPYAKDEVAVPANFRPVSEVQP
ncbi:MAG: DUF4494 domain-containing protein [Ferruginibacter sp.]|nr:DUF4494 domain-containing protein [Cytophagales bacterium]